jgi:hypothetical protein
MALSRDPILALLGVEQEVAMLTVRMMAPADALTLLGASPPAEGIEKAFWDRCAENGSLTAFVALREDEMVGLALAESHPPLVNVLNLEGGTDACRVLVNRLLEFAEDRSIGVWCNPRRADVHGMLEGAGFARHGGDKFQWVYLLERHTP